MWCHVILKNTLRYDGGEHVDDILFGHNTKQVRCSTRCINNCAVIVARQLAVVYPSTRHFRHRDLAVSQPVSYSPAFHSCVPWLQDAYCDKYRRGYFPKRMKCMICKRDWQETVKTENQNLLAASACTNCHALSEWLDVIYSDTRYCCNH